MTLYHVSPIRNLTYLRPQIPEVVIASREDQTIPRVCVSNTIDGCLMSVGYSKRDTLSVYVIDEPVAIYRPTRAQVRDAKFTGEVWIKRKAKVKKIGEVLLVDYAYIQHKSGRTKMSLPKYSWEWIQGGIE